MQPRLRLQQQPQTLVMVVVLFICTLPFGLGYGEREAGPRDKMPGLGSERDEDNDLIRWWYWVGIVNRGLMDKFTTSVPSA
jgi:hypothetical protein